MQIHMTKQHIQSVIAYNKSILRELETERAYLKHIIGVYWRYSNPLSKDISSETAFACLNKAKGELRVLRKKIKTLSELQSALKKACY